MPNPPKSLGIMFSAPMVRAILDDRKTQTRRVIASVPDDVTGTGLYAPTMVNKRTGEEYPGPDVVGIWGDDWDIKARFQPGDTLWVKEKWRYYASTLNPVANFGIQYRADDDIHYYPDWDKAMQSLCERNGKWRNPMFMPRWASRITLTVTDVRVERLQDISEADANAEGVSGDLCVSAERAAKMGAAEIEFDYRTSYAALWDSINGKNHPWASNPWVEVITFKREAARG